VAIEQDLRDADDNGWEALLNYQNKRIISTRKSI